MRFWLREVHNNGVVIQLNFFDNAVVEVRAEVGLIEVGIFQGSLIDAQKLQ